jgi:hypothetical protein
MGKSSTPPAPDYAAAAQQTAQGNLDAARYATAANRPTQITPYGTSTWTRGASTRTFDQARYDADYKAAQEEYARQQRAAARSLAGGGTGGYSGDEDYWGSGGGGNTLGISRAAAPTPQFVAPNKKDAAYWKDTPSDDWTQTITLTPEQQQLLDKQTALSNRYADAATVGMDRAYEALSDPMLDMSQLPARALESGQTAQEAILARLNPQFEQQEEALRARLANQGINVGSEAFMNDFRQFNQKRNDAELQAALRGIEVDERNRASALSEMAYLKDRPLNLINALRTGAQVQNPAFPNFAQQQATPGPNMMDAATQGYNAALDGTNASNAASGQLTGGLFSLGSAALMAF